MFVLTSGQVLAAWAQTAGTLTLTAIAEERRADGSRPNGPIYQGQPGTSAAALYTVPTNATTFVNQMSVVNNAASTQKFSVFVGGTAATNRLTPDISIPANGFASYDDNGWKIYDANGVVQSGSALSGPPSGAASGELAGTYPSPTVAATHSGSAHHVAFVQADHDALANPHHVSYVAADHTAVGSASPHLGLATNAILLGTAAGAGAAGTTLRSNDTIAAFDATVPAAVTPDAAAAAGSIAFAARRDHQHGVATSAASPITVDATAAAAGTSAHAPSRDDHRHQLGAHGIASHTDVTRNLWLKAEDSTLDSGAFASLGSTPNQLRVVALADAATQGCLWNFVCPDDWASGVITVQPYWVPGSTDGTAHTVRWTFVAKTRAAAADVTAAGTSTVWTGASATRTASLLVKDTATSTTITPAAVGDLFMLEVQRIGADAADTYVGVVNLVGCWVSYTATQ